MIKEAPVKQKSIIKDRTVHFWTGIIVRGSIESQLAPIHQEALRRCFEDPQSVDFEKLRGYDSVYSIRYSHSGRMLLTEMDSRLVVLAILPNHEYEKALKKLSKGILKQFKKGKKPQGLWFEKTACPFEDQTKGNPTSSTNYKRVALENDSHTNALKMLVLDDTQEQALRVPMPAFISGLPGSGKTSIAMALLHTAKTLGQGEKALYMTQSKALAKHVSKEFKRFAFDLEDKVDILCYDDVLNDQNKSQSDENKDNEAIVSGQQSYDLFQAWFKPFAKTQVKKLKSLGLTYQQANMVYQEFRLLSGYELSQYLDVDQVGHKQSLFNDLPQRVFIQEAFTEFQQHCEAQGYLLAEFTPLPISATTYKLVLIDEAQDFSNLQIKEIMVKLSKNIPQIAMFFGDGQSLADDLPNKIFIQMLLNGIGKLTKVTLSTPYRCRDEIMALASGINQLRLAITPKNKQEVVSHPQKKPNNDFILCHPLSSLSQLKDEINSHADYCLITHPNLVTLVTKQYAINDFQVFTPAQAKGLQFKKVFLFDPLHDRTFNQINQLIKTYPNGQVHQHLRDVAYSTVLSQLYVAITRAQDAIIWLIPDKHSELRQYWGLPKARDLLKPLAPSLASPSSSRDWHQQAIRIAQQGQKDRAIAILTSKLGWDQTQIEHFEEAYGLKAKSRQMGAHTASSRPTTVSNPQTNKKKKNQKPSVAAFLKAILNDDVKFMASGVHQQWLDKHGLLKEGEHKGSSPLALAMAWRCKLLVEYFLSQGYTFDNCPFVLNHKRQSIFGHLVSHKAFTYLSFLIDNTKLDINHLYDGESLLHWVVQIWAGKSEQQAERFVDQLINKGADLNRLDGLGRSPLFIAVPKDTRLIQLLVENGANPLQEQGDGPYKGNIPLMQLDLTRPDKLTKYLFKQSNYLNKPFLDGPLINLNPFCKAILEIPVEALLHNFLILGADLDHIITHGPYNRMSVLEFSLYHLYDQNTISMLLERYSKDKPANFQVSLTNGMSLPLAQLIKLLPKAEIFTSSLFGNLKSKREATEASKSFHNYQTFSFLYGAARLKILFALHHGTLKHTLAELKPLTSQIKQLLNLSQSKSFLKRDAVLPLQLVDYFKQTHINNLCLRADILELVHFFDLFAFGNRQLVRNHLALIHVNEFTYRDPFHHTNLIDHLLDPLAKKPEHSIQIMCHDVWEFYKDWLSIDDYQPEPPSRQITYLDALTKLCLHGSSLALVAEVLYHFQDSIKYEPFTRIFVFGDRRENGLRMALESLSQRRAYELIELLLDILADRLQLEDFLQNRRPNQVNGMTDTLLTLLLTETDNAVAAHTLFVLRHQLAEDKHLNSQILQSNLLSAIIDLINFDNAELMNHITAMIPLSSQLIKAVLKVVEERKDVMIEENKIDFILLKEIMSKRLALQEAIADLEHTPFDRLLVLANSAYQAGYKNAYYDAGLALHQSGDPKAYTLLSYVDSDCMYYEETVKLICNEEILPTSATVIFSDYQSLSSDSELSDTSSEFEEKEPRPTRPSKPS